MHVNDALRSGLLVQRIDILGAKKEPLRHGSLELRQGEVRRIGHNGLVPLSALCVELPHQRRIGRESFWGGDLFNAIPSPQSVRAAKRRKPTFGADPGAGEHEEMIFRRQRIHGWEQAFR
jgi:hypothetical protein